jgi:hypothetical protein
MSRLMFGLVVALCVWIGYVVGSYTERMAGVAMCKEYFRALPEKERVDVCREVLGVKR